MALIMLLSFLVSLPYISSFVFSANGTHIREKCNYVGRRLTARYDSKNGSLFIQVDVAISGQYSTCELFDCNVNLRDPKQTVIARNATYYSAKFEKSIDEEILAQFRSESHLMNTVCWDTTDRVRFRQYWRMESVTAVDVFDDSGLHIIPLESIIDSITCPEENKLLVVQARFFKVFCFVIY